jgi:hypothetical protein
MTDPVVELANPYPGLAPFEEQDSSRFFGRDGEIEEMLDRMASRRLVAVIGVSGCGKSSLVRAGVIPVLRLGAASEMPAHWRIYAIIPGNDPIRSLQEALEAPPEWPSTSFDLADHARSRLRSDESLLLIVDQFEELFRFRDETLVRDGGNEASLFINLLLKAVEQREVPIYVLLTMRTDFLGKCAQFRGLPEALNDCYYMVPRMTRLQQQEAIEQPLHEQGESVHPALVQRLLNDSAEDPDHLPVLQHLLKRLWENWRIRGAGGPIGTEDYDAIGGWANALNGDAETVLGQFSNDENGIRRLFQWITERGTGDKPIRRPRPLAECVEVSGLERVRLKEVVLKFQERGLLRPSNRSDQSLVDLPHESVMWQWSRLKDWIAEEAEQASQLRFLLQSARQKNPLTGLALVSASQLCGKMQWPSMRRYLQPQELEQTQAWIVHSEQIEQAKRRRRLWIFGGIGAMAVILAIIAAWVVQKQQNSTQARELADWAVVSLGEDPERSLILGSYAWGKHQEMIPGLEDLLHAAVWKSSSLLTLRGHEGKVVSVAWSPDGSKLATVSTDQTAKVWDAGTGRELLTLHGHRGTVASVAWSPNGRKLATASDDKTAKVWDASTGRELLTLHGHQNEVWDIMWSPDGNKLATASLDNTAKVWDAGMGRELLTLRGHDKAVVSVAWSPDGRKLATGSYDRTAKGVGYEYGAGVADLAWP